jgi:hypothetical protein
MCGKQSRPQRTNELSLTIAFIVTAQLSFPFMNLGVKLLSTSRLAQPVLTFEVCGICRTICLEDLTVRYSSIGSGLGMLRLDIRDTLPKSYYEFPITSAFIRRLQASQPFKLSTRCNKSCYTSRYTQNSFHTVYTGPVVPHPMTQHHLTSAVLAIKIIHCRSCSGHR